MVNIFPWLFFLDTFILYNFFCPDLLCLVFLSLLFSGTNNDLNLPKMKEPIGVWVPAEYHAQIQNSYKYKVVKTMVFTSMMKHWWYFLIIQAIS